MSLPHALLTALIDHPCSGFELSSRFDRSIGFYWHATHQQIYRELGRMEEAGWLASTPAESGRGRKKIYEVLPAGKKELRRWAGEAHDTAPPRTDLLIRLRAEAALGGTGVAQEIERRLAAHRRQLELYQEVQRREFDHRTMTRNLAIHQLTLTAGIMNEQMWIAWSEHALQVLANQQPAPAISSR